MKFLSQKRPQPTIPIVSMIDILAILLIFFIVTTTFKKRQSLVSVNLPQSSELKSTSEKSARLALEVSAEGNMVLDGTPVTFENLSTSLGLVKSARPDARMELKVDGAVPLETVVKIWDSATRAGVKIADIPLRIQVKK
ncbi:MAG TPA: biopolymer transporter ExbD [Verrucomicrobiales bacterium]|nr:biopolymer transporter ExbD [Verrucomicrobiae bacterium]MCP5552814.1 biopolymer transporter ExbD [Akkermansiaceae bacterium]HRX54592.1 biopolymer transporter ExbD [Verrucomicrobiales bacterium]